VLRTEHYAAGDTFVPQEGAANDLYVLRSGQIELIVEDGKNGGQRLTIGAPRNGEGASSMSLLLSVPHSVSARVLADAELHVLRGDDLRSLLGGAWSAQAPGNGEAAQAAASVGLVPG
jgi:CRP-like cAMP-binding protein